MNHIADLRKNAGLTQTQLAEYLGISQNTLSQYETGKRNIDIKTVQMLSEYFSVTINQILGIPEPEDSNDIPGDKPILWFIRKVETVSNLSRCNQMLDAGWKLLHIGEESSYSEGQYSTVVYTLGWTGDPKDALAVMDLEDASERQADQL